MTFELYTKSSAKFYFKEEELRGKDRDSWNKFKYTLRNTDNPRQWEVASCPNHSINMLLHVPESGTYAAIRCYDVDNLHPDFGKCIFILSVGPIDDYRYYVQNTSFITKF